MNDLGWALGWAAVQATILLLPAIGLHVLASRRGAVAGAWVATFSLAMVVLLGASGLVARTGGEAGSPAPKGPGRTSKGPVEAPKSGPLARSTVAVPAPEPTASGRAFERFRIAWDGLGRRAAVPVGRLWPWSKAIAIASLAGSGVGLARLLIGLWSVALCRSRGRLVDDPAMIGLVEELRGGMGCSTKVELREVMDLATPATAGWLRPMLLLPGNWRDWGEPERRAVVAHELAHVVRGDYAAGLVAKVAVVMHFYHPLVRWMAGRLHLEQELAADAMGARFAGGRSSYLRALSRLVLEQDGRPSNWPARAFLPGRKTMIRRIAMLRDETDATIGRAWSRSSRLAAALGLMALTIGLATWKAPARASDEAALPAPPAGQAPKAAEAVGGLRPFPVEYIPEGRLGVVALRPSATLAHPGMASVKPQIRMMADMVISQVARGLGVDPSRPGFLKLKAENLESVLGSFDVGVADAPGGGPKGYRLLYGPDSCVILRTVAPFDWLAFLRQWKVETEEVREARGTYRRIKQGDPARKGPSLALYLPDDRTIVYEAEDVIKALIAREVPTAPAYLRGPGWERVSRDLVAFAADAPDDGLARRFSLGRPEDAPILAAFKGVDRLMFGLADAEPMTARAEVTGRDAATAEAIARSIRKLPDLGRGVLDSTFGPIKEFQPIVNLGKRFLAAIVVKQDGRVITASAEGFGSFADLGEFLNTLTSVGVQMGGARPDAPKPLVAPKPEKR